MPTYTVFDSVPLSFYIYLHLFNAINVFPLQL